jgi:hypothetical protein
MATLKSKQFVLGVIGAGATTYTVPANAVDTIQQFTFHNTSAAIVTVTATLNSVQIFEALSIPVGGQPTIVFGMLGARMTAAQVLSITASTQDVITVSVSGIEEVSGA